MAVVGMLLVLLALLVLAAGIATYPLAVIGPVAFCAFLVAGVVLVAGGRIADRLRALEALVRGDDREP